MWLYSEATLDLWSDIIVMRERDCMSIFQLITGTTVELTERSYTVTEGEDIALFVCASIATALEETCPVDFAFEISLNVGGGIVNYLT